MSVKVIQNITSNNVEYPVAYARDLWYIEEDESVMTVQDKLCSIYDGKDGDTKTVVYKG